MQSPPPPRPSLPLSLSLSLSLCCSPLVPNTCKTTSHRTSFEPDRDFLVGSAPLQARPWNLALNDAPGSDLFFDMDTGGNHDTSSCSTTSDQSDRRKRSSPIDEESSYKPYECRFCPMKFAKSQALGGHMNRHRQEREREQIVQARQLLMQQEFSSVLLMSGQNPSTALPKLNQAQLQRSASESTLKDGIRTGVLPFGAAASGYRGVLPSSNPYNPPQGPSSLSWNLGNVVEASQNSESAFSLEGGMVPSYQNRPAYVSPMNNNTSYNMQPQPLNRAQGQHDMMSSIPYDKATMYALDSHTPTCTHNRGNSLSSQQNQAEEGSFLSGGPADDLATNLLSSNRNSVPKSPDMKNAHSLSQALTLQSQQNNGFQFFTTYPSTEGPARSLDFNLSSTNQLDGLPWMHGATKMVRSFNALSTSGNDDEYHDDVENSGPKMDDGVMDGEQPKSMRWDLSLTSSPDNVYEENKMKDLTPTVVGGVPTMHFDATYDNAASGMEGKESINK